MDDISHARFHAEAAARGYSGDAASLAQLLADALRCDFERRMEAFARGEGGKPLDNWVRMAFDHARKHGAAPYEGGSDPRRLTFMARREDKGARLGRVELREGSVRLVFFKDGECVGERNFGAGSARAPA